MLVGRVRLIFATISLEMNLRVAGLHCIAMIKLTSKTHGPDNNGQVLFLHRLSHAIYHLLYDRAYSE